MPVTRKRYAVSTVFAAVVVVATLTGAGAAWAAGACFGPQASLAAEPSSGTAGSNVLVRGDNFGGPVDIYWNSRGGTRLATAATPNFAVEVKIPAAPPGVYYIVAVAPAATGSSVDQQASTSFTVVAPSSQSNSNGSPPGQSQTNGSTSGADEDEAQPAESGTTGANQRDGQRANSGQTSGSRGTGGGTRAQAGSNGSAPPVAATDPVASTDASAAATSAPATARQGSLRTAPASSNPAAVATPSGQVVFGGSVPAMEDPQAAPTPAMSAASSDLWSGFNAGPASMVPSLVDVTPSAAPRSSPALAAGLLAAGLAALFGGFALQGLSLRRQRAVASR